MYMGIYNQMYFDSWMEKLSTGLRRILFKLLKNNDKRAEYGLCKITA